jgi:hypothetical protein
LRSNSKFKGIIEQYFDLSAKKLSLTSLDHTPINHDFLEVSEEEESKEQTPAESDSSSIMTPRKKSLKEPKKVEHESKLHE